MSGHRERFLRRLTRSLGYFAKRRLWQKGFHESLAADRWSADEIRAYHDKRLVALVRHAAAHIPFYRELYKKSGVDVATFHGTADMPMLPTVSKEDILRAGGAMVRPGVSNLRIVRHTTGGSTGTIATMVSPRGSGDWENGCIYAMWSRMGVRRGDRMALLRGAVLDEGRTMFRREPDGKSLVVSTYHLNDDTVGEIIELIDGFAPDWLHVYPSAASLLANIMERTGRRLSCPLRGVLCGSEKVYEWQVEIFQRAFGGCLYSHYGHGEMVLLGGWCEKTRMFHFLPNHGYLELLDDHRHPVTEPGVAGEMTGTGYDNEVMPLIRYRTADYGAWDRPGPCPSCGRHHQRLATIDGRIQEYLILRDGRRFPVTNINALHGPFFTLIYRFQFVQDRPGHATLRFVPAVEMTPRRLAEIREAFQYLGGLGLEITYEPAPEIAVTRSGKQRLVVTSEDLAREQK